MNYSISLSFTMIIGERTRNCECRDRILWSMRPKLGEFSQACVVYMLITLFQSVPRDLIS